MSFLASKSRLLARGGASRGQLLLQRSYRATATSTLSNNKGAALTLDLDHFASGWNFVEDIDDFRKSGGTNSIQTFNKLSTVGLSVFDPTRYKVSASLSSPSNEPANALLLRSHKLQLDEIDVSVRAIARCGAGTNNIPVPELTALGIPVFNTPGANANAVKELILCALLLGSRKIVHGINHMKALGEQGIARERVGTWSKLQEIYGIRVLPWVSSSSPKKRNMIDSTHTRIPNISCSSTYLSTYLSLLVVF